MMGFRDAAASARSYANNLQLAPTPHQSVFTGRTPNQQCQSTKGTTMSYNKQINMVYALMNLGWPRCERISRLRP